MNEMNMLDVLHWAPCSTEYLVPDHCFCLIVLAGPRSSYFCNLWCTTSSAPDCHLLHSTKQDVLIVLFAKKQLSRIPPSLWLATCSGIGFLSRCGVHSPESALTLLFML